MLDSAALPTTFPQGDPMFARLTVALLVVCALLMPSVPGRAETVNCTPLTSLPAVISVSGIHCLTGDLSTSMTSGIAVEITANNVILDLNGFRLGASRPASTR